MTIRMKRVHFIFVFLYGRRREGVPRRTGVRRIEQNNLDRARFERA